MQKKPYIFTCPGVCWVVGIAFGLLIAISFGFGVFLGLIVAVVVGVAAAFFLQWAFCHGQANHAVGNGEAPAAPVAKVTTTEAAKVEPVAAVAAPAVIDAVTQPAPKVATESDTPAATVPAKAKPDERPVAADGKPELLKAARDGKADNLKEIKGVGPKLEAMLHKMGVFHFDQIASWRAAEIEWVDANLEGFKGRVKRDTWVEQATVLAAGGTTEFAARVGKGGVY